MDRRKLCGRALAALFVSLLPRAAAIIARTQRQFLAAIRSAPPGSTVKLGPGTFSVPDGTVVRGLRIIGNGRTTIRTWH